MDYGRVYDRSEYDEQAALLERQENVRKQMEKEQLSVLQPITTDMTNPDGKIIFDQDTSIPDGFISKLVKQDQAKFKDSGIISPEEGLGMFSKLGSNMFLNAEDRELVEDIMGGKKSTKKETKNESGSNNQSNASSKNKDDKRMTDLFGGGDNDDDELMQSLKKSIGDKNLNDEDIFNANGGKGTSKKGSSPLTDNAYSVFDAIMGSNSKVSIPSKDTVESSRNRLENNNDGFIPVPGSANSNNTPKTPLYRPALSPKEAEVLTKSLDDMTDAEVTNMLMKLQQAVGGKLKDELSDALMSGMNMNGNDDDMTKNGGIGVGSTDKIMPRARAIDPTIRQKYDKELNAIEDELEKIYKDPLGVWQELMKNPEKFNENEDIIDPEKLLDKK